MRYKSTSIWKKEERKDYEKSYEETDLFFEDLYLQEKDDINHPLIYRESQHSYALDIMEAIKNKQVLLIQAGVGNGKSIGYLIPIFYTYKNVEKFNKVLISTSSIALQQQLLTDINRISNMLKIELKASIAKGINNYACLRKIESWIRSDRTPAEKKLILEQLAIKMEELSTSDKEDLKEFSEIIWKDVQLQSRGYCSNCSYTKRCPFYQKQQEIKNSNIVITNHANLIRNVLDEGDLVQEVDMIIADEVHQLEGNMRNQKQQEFYLKNIEKFIDQVNNLIRLSFTNQTITSIYNEPEVEYIEVLKRDIEKLFSAIRTSSSINFSKTNKTNHSIVESNRLGFQYGRKIIEQLTKVLNGFQLLFQDIHQYELQTGNLVQTTEFKKLKEIYSLFQDMAKLENSSNIYWASFFQKNLINLCCAPKNNLEVSKKIFSKKIPIVCTSATMLDNKDSYRYFMEGIGLEGIQNQTVSLGENYTSPFDYPNNTLCYYDSTIATPDHYQDYILDLAIKIDELLQVTNGKALILFTSKKCMNDVYSILSTKNYKFNLLLHTETNANEVKETFSQDTNSCLFATGAFWEGIDIKGKSLSNLIITHLPFDVVDAVTQYKASKYKDKKDQFQEVYIPSMLLKLEQAMGRLIRSNTDTGIISFLDSRFSKYINLVKENTQFPNYTTNMQEVIQFAESKILTGETSTKHYSKDLKKEEI